MRSAYRLVEVPAGFTQPLVSITGWMMLHRAHLQKMLEELKPPELEREYRVNFHLDQNGSTL